MTSPETGDRNDPIRQRDAEIINGRYFTREEIEAGLDDPGAPYGLAHKSELLLRYFAPMLCGDVERAELCRRLRVAEKRGKEENEKGN